MMNKGKFFLIFTLLLIIFILPKANEGVSVTQKRSHEFIQVDEKFYLEFTSIFSLIRKAPKEEESLTILLLELNEFGKWIFQCHLKRKDKIYEITKFFENLNTKEILKISSTAPADAFEAENYVLWKGEDENNKVIVRKEEIPQNPSTFHPFVINNFTKSFVEGLNFLKEISYKIYNKQIYFQITPYDFMPIYGKNRESQFEKIPNKNPIILNYNCDFDAQFGYPCQPEEVPSKNQKILIIEK